MRNAVEFRDYLINEYELNTDVLLDKRFTSDLSEIRTDIYDITEFCEKYGILIYKIESHESDYHRYITVSINVPERSELKSEREFEMAGIYLANQFKTKFKEFEKRIDTVFKWMANGERFAGVFNINKFINMKSSRVKVTYTSTTGTFFTEDSSENALEQLDKDVENMIDFPF